MKRTVGPLSEAVVALTDELLRGELDAGLRTAVRAVARTLEQDRLRIAVGGAVSTGKSTLVNALVGRQVAEVRPDETRRVTAVYRAAGAGGERVTLRFTDGSERPLAFTPAGRLPDVPAGETRDPLRFEVELDCPALDGVAIVDTPGLFSGDGHHSTIGHAALVGTSEREDRDTRREMRDADALVFLIGDVASSADADLLRRFRDVFAGWGKSPFNAVALVGKADAVTQEIDSFEAAAEQAAEARNDLRTSVAEVVPVSALLAETATTGALTGEDFALLQALAADPPPAWQLVNGAIFERLHGEPGARLLGKLDLYGLSFALREARGTDLAGLHRALEQRSGLERVRRLLHEQFLVHADIIKAASALSDLDAAAERAGATRVRHEIERTRRQDAFHHVEEVLVYQDAAQGRLDLPPRLRGELERLLAPRALAERLGIEGDADARELTSHASNARRLWSDVSNDALRSLRARRAAQVAVRTVQMLERA